MANLSISTAWNETAEFLKREAGLILPIAFLLIAVPGALMQILMPEPATPGAIPEAGAWLLIFPVAIIASMIGTIAISTLALRPGTSVGEALQRGMRRFIMLFLASLLLGIVFALIAIPLFLVIAGGAVFAGGLDPAAVAGPIVLVMLILFVILLALWVRLMLMTPVAAAEEVGPVAIIQRSWNLTSGRFWKLLGFALLLMIVGIVIVFAITAIIGILIFALAGSPEPGSTSMILMTIVSALLQSVLSAVFVTMIARIYAQLAGTPPAEVFA